MKSDSSDLVVSVERLSTSLDKAGMMYPEKGVS